MPRKKKEYNHDIGIKVEAYAALGINLLDISKLINMSHPTLRRVYAEDWERGRVKAHSKIAKTLFDKAVSGDTASLIFWCKTQLGWRETQHVDHTSSDGSMTAQPQKIVVEYVDSPKRNEED